MAAEDRSGPTAETTERPVIVDDDIGLCGKCRRFGVIGECRSMRTADTDHDWQTAAEADLGYRCLQLLTAADSVDDPVAAADTLDPRARPLG